MNLEQDLLEALAKQVIEKGTGVEKPDPDGSLTTFMIDDITATFRQKDGKHTFFGIVFEALGRDFIIMEGGGIFLRSGDDEATYQVTDSQLFSSLESFLKWRFNTLISVGV